MNICTSDRELCSIALSPDGNYLAIGISCANEDAPITVWNLKDSVVQCKCYGHKHGVQCMKFSNNMSFLTSVGVEKDGQVYVFDYLSGESISCGIVQSRVYMH